MKKFYLFLIFSFLFPISLMSNEDKKSAAELLDFPKIKKEKKEKKTLKKIPELVSFVYNNEEITNIINELSAIKRINIIFPQPPAKISAKVTFAMNEEIPVEDAWKILITILDIAGYSIIKKENFYHIVKNENVTREPLPIYVNSINTLPNTDEKIRYIYFFKNISIVDPTNPANVNIDQILKDMLANEAEGGTYILDNATNSIIIVGKSNSIKGVMKIIEELDTAGFPETIEVLPLFHANSDFIAKIINQLLPGTQEPQFRYGPFPTRPSKIGGYFSEQTKIISIDRTNSLAILGFSDSVKKIKDFIEKHLDLPIQSEKSIIHVKSLQYLDADLLAPVIQNLVKSRATAAQAEPGGEKDTLANSVIVAEKLVQAATISPTVAANAQATAAPSTSAPLIGGNRLIVAARYQDWLTIDKLIDEIDQPQQQVAIEVLVVDLTIGDNHQLGAQIRNTLNGINPSFANFQSAQLTIPWLNFISDDPNAITAQGLASDLLRMTKNPPYSNGTTPVNMAMDPSVVNTGEGPTTPVGSTIISFKNGNGISTVLRVLEAYNSATILSQPFVISKNNQQANISIAREILKQGPVDTSSTGGPVVRKVVPYKADLTVNILPRISKSAQINLEILVNVNDFVDGTDNNVITTRQVRTNANLSNKEVLILGGLTKTTTRDVVRETPLLGKIPVIGFLFKNKIQEINKNNLMIFISPTVIRPRIQGGTDTYTQNKVNYTKDQVLEDEIDLLGTNFEKLRDPITRVFFTPLGKQVNASIDYYTEQLTYKDSINKISIAEDKIRKYSSNKNLRKRDFESSRSERVKKLVRNDENPLLRVGKL